MIPNWQKLKTDPAFRARMEKRQVIIASVREFFRSRGFFEAETPIVVPVPGTEPHLDPFAVTVRTQAGRDIPAALITSPEYSLKKLLAAGYEQLFEITRVFRNGEPWGPDASADGSTTHNPEFTMIEWYRAHADYAAIMRDTEEMVAEAARRLSGGTLINSAGRAIALAPPWPRLTVAAAMKKYADLDLAAALDDSVWFRAEVEKRGFQVGATDTFDDLFFKIFLRDVESHLGEAEKAGEPERPVILCEYPASMAALSRLKPGDSRYAERFEVYCGGLELGNAYSELTDAVEQRRRIEADNAARAKAGRPVYGTDEHFVAAVGELPPCAGIAFGLDRLVMLLTDAPDIQDVLFFPARDLFH